MQDDQQCRDQVCDCGCHRPGVRAMHIVACCHPCRHCGKRVRVDQHMIHQLGCERNPDRIEPAPVHTIQLGYVESSSHLFGV